MAQTPSTHTSPASPIIVKAGAGAAGAKWVGGVGWAGAAASLQPPASDVGRGSVGIDRCPVPCFRSDLGEHLDKSLG